VATVNPTATLQHQQNDTELLCKSVIFNFSLIIQMFQLIADETIEKEKSDVLPLAELSASS